MLDYESAQPGEDHPEARDRTVHNLKFIGWAMHNFTKRNAGRLPAAACRIVGAELLARSGTPPFLEEFPTCRC